MSYHEYLLTALTIGLLGSVHCIGMCGGIVGALTLSIAPQAAVNNARLLSYLTAYNFGRITSYSIAGAIAGLLGGTLLSVIDTHIAMLFTRILTGLFLLALGLYLAGWTQFLAPIEKSGQHLWKLIQPISQRFIPIRSLSQAFATGLVWGWLPCGLVYSALIWALASGDIVIGAAIMLIFGIATLPALFLSGLSAAKFSHLTKNIWLRRLIGALLITMALFKLFTTSHHHIA